MKRLSERHDVERELMSQLLDSLNEQDVMLAQGYSSLELEDKLSELKGLLQKG